jgi:hypothetical protein
MWIDSLCIIQDDKDDIEREILQMPNIYKNAGVTICASIGESCYDGFLQPRPDFSQIRIPVTLSKQLHGIIYLDQYQFADPPVREVLATRAWALQERLISPRVLEYGWRTVRWTCSCRNGYNGQTSLSIIDTHSGSAGNISEYSLFLYVSPSGLRFLPRSKEELLKGWASLVAEYSQLQLTKREDRLAAIGGIAQELQRMTGVPYLAGLWNYEKLPSLLQWKVISPADELSSRPTRHRAPSWSWAGVDGSVGVHCSEEVVSGFRIIDSHVTGGFGTTAQGSITMEGPTRTGTWWQAVEKLRIGPKHGFTGTVDTWTESFILWPDCADEFTHSFVHTVTTADVQLTFIAIGRVSWNRKLVRGLVLKINDAHTDYIRVGLFQCPDEGETAIETWRLRTVVII